MEDYKKKYENALERANAKIETYNRLGNASMVKSICDIFPELKESEDEILRKWLIKYFDKVNDVVEVDRKKVISWLEKQGEKVNENNEEIPLSEQKPTDKVKPKFNVGDWVVRNCKNNDTVIHKVVNIRLINDDCEIYGYELDDFTYVSGSFENEYRLWTIQDAKDGDVLVASDGSIFIFKEIEDCGCKHYIALEKDSKTIKINDNLKHFWESIRGVKPATKEQRDLLFQKMKEAGYEWDAEKKELKKIEQCENYHCCGEVDNEALQKTLQIWFDKGKCSGRDEVIFHPEKFGLQKQGKKKPVMIQWQGNNLKEVINFTGKDKNFEKWFKSFEEYEKYVNDHNGIFKLFNIDGSHYEVPIGSWIVKTPDGYNVASKTIFKQKPTWSEEDERYYDSALWHIKNSCGIEGNVYNWLKSLKERYIWKPSDEQMNFLWKYAEQNNYDGAVLTSLFRDLKKLK